jgi:hypothetical protein
MGRNQQGILGIAKFLAFEFFELGKFLFDLPHHLLGVRFSHQESRCPSRLIAACEFRP